LSQKYLLSFVGVILLSTSLLISACGVTNTPQAGQLDSGSVDQNYQGVAQPKPPGGIKLSEDEAKNGIKKFPIKSSTGQQIIPDTQVQETPGQDKEGQAKDVAKPQV